MTHVLLLRAPTNSPTSADPYAAHFAGLGAGVRALSVPVLETGFTLDELQWVVETGPGFHGFKGVVVTSARAVEAWAQAAQSVLKNSDGDHLKVNWKSTPFYVVGESTAAAVNDLSSSLPAHLLPIDVLGAEESGTSEKLAQFILAHLAQGDGNDTKKKKRPKLLFLTGDKTRDVLQTILSGGGVELDAVQVYETRPSPSFAADLAATVKANSKGAKSWWIAFFAPSAADAALPVLREHFTLPAAGAPNGQQKAKKKAPPPARIAAIGPTTAAHLNEKLSLKVAAVAAKPGPEELASAIMSAQ